MVRVIYRVSVPPRKASLEGQLQRGDAHVWTANVLEPCPYLIEQPLRIALMYLTFSAPFAHVLTAIYCSNTSVIEECRAKRATAGTCCGATKQTLQPEFRKLTP